MRFSSFGTAALDATRSGSTRGTCAPPNGTKDPVARRPFVVIIVTRPFDTDARNLIPVLERAREEFQRRAAQAARLVARERAPSSKMP